MDAVPLTYWMSPSAKKRVADRPRQPCGRSLVAILGVPAPELNPGELGSQAMSPAATMTTELVIVGGSGAHSQPQRAPPPAQPPDERRTERCDTELTPLRRSREVLRGRPIWLLPRNPDKSVKRHSFRLMQNQGARRRRTYRTHQCGLAVRVIQGTVHRGGSGICGVGHA